MAGSDKILVCLLIFLNNLKYNFSAVKLELVDTDNQLILILQPGNQLYELLFRGYSTIC